MANTNRLFELIHSLSKNEKRYFKLFAGFQMGEKKYLLLFDAIAEQKEYDEQKIITKFKGERFLKQLPVAKNY